jgi:dTDP-4-amino-4,6-dideoxygalactose transaminase
MIGGEGVPRRVYLSPPHMSGEEEPLVAEAFASNWIAPVGAHVDRFEAEFAEKVGARHAIALSSGTAGIHLALQASGVGAGDTVLVSSLTFVASVNPIRYLGAEPVLVDSEQTSWNLDPDLVENLLSSCAKRGVMPAALLVVHLYGQTANVSRLVRICETYGVTLIEDAAEALGSDHGGQPPGTFGKAGVFSFNGNKIITTSGGGMLVTNDSALAAKARKLATQARENFPYYEHVEVGYNYRLSNLLAAVGRGQLKVLEERVLARRRNFTRYQEALGALPGLSFQPEAPWGRHTRWLTCVQVEPRAFGATAEQLRIALEAANIEARPLWKPMHLQPLYAGCRTAGGHVAEKLFRHGLCLPSGSNLSSSDINRVVEVVRQTCRPAQASTSALNGPR